MNREVAPFIAVNIGNTTAQFGRVSAFDSHGTPHIASVLELASHELDVDQLAGWLPPGHAFPWYIASVFRAADERLRAWIADREPAMTAIKLSCNDFGLMIDVDRPERVGIDRLAAATAACHHKAPHCAACVVDAGTAITIDALTAGGTFLGGAICPGTGIAARALQRYTDALPLVMITGHDVPPVIGKNTEGAISSGLYWGAVGTVERIINEIEQQLEGVEIELFFTGGMRKPLAQHLGRPAKEFATLVLQGVALTAERLRAASSDQRV